MKFSRPSGQRCNSAKGGTDGKAGFRRLHRVRLAPVDEGHPNEASVALLSTQVLDPFNRKQVSPESSMTVEKFRTTPLFVQNCEGLGDIDNCLNKYH